MISQFILEHYGSMFFIGGTMKKILLFSFLFIIIPVLSIFLLIVEPNNYKFSFSVISTLQLVIKETKCLIL